MPGSGEDADTSTGRAQKAEQQPACEKRQAYIQGKTLKDRNVYKVIQTVHVCACVRVCMCVSACQHVCVCI